VREKALIPPGLYLCPPPNWMPIKLLECEIGSVMEPVILFRENIYRRVYIEILLGLKYPVVPRLEAIMNRALRQIIQTFYAYGLGFASAKISMELGSDLRDLILENASLDFSTLKELCARVWQQDFDLCKDCAGDGLEIETEININATNAEILDGDLAAAETSKIKIPKLIFQRLLTDLPAYQILTVALHPTVDDANKVDFFNENILGPRNTRQHQSALTTIVGDLLTQDFIVAHFTVYVDYTQLSASMTSISHVLDIRL